MGYMWDFCMPGPGLNSQDVWYVDHLSLYHSQLNGFDHQPLTKSTKLSLSCGIYLQSVTNLFLSWFHNLLSYLNGAKKTEKLCSGLNDLKFF